MARLTRYTQSIFGSTAGTNQIAEFGSYANNTPTRYSGTTITPAIVQTLGQYAGGWFSAVLGTYDPAIEDRNAIDYLFSYQLAYLLQAGIAEWDSGTTYYVNDRVSYNGIVYRSAIDTNLNNTPATGSSNWTTSSSPIISTNPTNVVGWLFAASSSFTASPGSVYSNNGNNYTCLSVNTGNTLFWSVTNTATPSPTTSSGTLTKVSGTGSSTLSYAYAQQISSITTPTNATNAQFWLVGGGGAGAGSGTTGTVIAGTNGRSSGLMDLNGTNIIACAGGFSATPDTTGSPGFGGSTSVSVKGTYSYTLQKLGGESGDGFNWVNTTGYFYGGKGGNSFFASGGTGGQPGGGALSVSGSSGSGGGGGGNNPSVAGAITGSGGGAGGFINLFITGPDLATTYYYSLGAGGTASSGGTSGFLGNTGGSGTIISMFNFY